MNAVQSYVNLFPPAISRAIQSSLPFRNGTLEEIRCRIGQPYVLSSSSGECMLQQRADASAMDYILERATNYSIHAFSSEMKEGYLHTDGGCRVGICGSISPNGFRNVSSISVRIPIEVVGCARPILEELLQSGIRSTLIVSPPGCGKTTLLRDMIRILSLRGYRVCVADERGEIAAMSERIPQFDLGPRTDVISGGAKAKSCLMMLRSMNPQILALDEITDPKDIEAVKCAAGCGVVLLASAHASDAGSLCDRPLYREILEEHIFEFAVEIQVVGARRVYRVVNL